MLRIRNNNLSSKYFEHKISLQNLAQSNQKQNFPPNHRSAFAFPTSTIANHSRYWKSPGLMRPAFPRAIKRKIVFARAVTPRKKAGRAGSCENRHAEAGPRGGSLPFNRCASVPRLTCSPLVPSFIRARCTRFESISAAGALPLPSPPPDPLSFSAGRIYESPPLRTVLPR